MLIAYDTFLQTIVKADLAAQNGADEPYRYECACCGEEVFVAAKYSKSMITHFRHRSGNNDVECENYLGKYGLLSANYDSRKKQREKAEFYYNSITKCFYIGIKFSESKLNQYESEDVVLEIRAQKNSDPFHLQKINSENFLSEQTKLIMLEKFSTTYFISNTFNPIRKAYTVFREGGPSFFKIQGNDGDFRAKLVRSEKLYTGVRYFVAQANGNGAQIKFNKLIGINVEQNFEFDFLHHHIWASIVTFEGKSQEIESVLETWGYNLDTPEEVMLLWPPSFTIDEINFIDSDYAYLYSSFRLQARGNINTSDSNLSPIDSLVTKIKVNKLTKVLRKNAEIEIGKLGLNIDLEEYQCRETYLREYLVPSDNKHFYFSNTGMRELKHGESVILTQDSFVYEYSNGQVIHIVRPLVESRLEGMELLLDILKHYKVEEPFVDYEATVKSEFLLDYINGCRKRGVINSLVKKYIEEGIL